MRFSFNFVNEWSYKFLNINYLYIMCIKQIKIKHFVLFEVNLVGRKWYLHLSGLIDTLYLSLWRHMTRPGKLIMYNTAENFLWNKVFRCTGFKICANIFSLKLHNDLVSSLLSRLMALRWCVREKGIFCQTKRTERNV